MKWFKIIYFILTFFSISCSVAPETSEGFITRGDVSIYYRNFGTGEPLIALHGGPGFDHHVLMPYISRLGKNFKVIVYDQRGSGQSSSPIDSASININTFMDDIETVRTHFNLDKINLAGFSWGGILAIYYGISHTGNIKSLILISTTASQAMVDQMHQTMLRNTTKADSKKLSEISLSEGFKKGNAAELEKFYRIFCKTQIADTSRINDINLTLTPNTIKNMEMIDKYIWSSIKDFNLLDSLKTISVPALILHGKYDPMPLESAYLMNQATPGSQLEIFNNSGHWIFVEEEEKFNRIITKFLGNQPNN